MSRREPETGCALIVLGSLLTLGLSVALGVLIDWRVPPLCYIGTAMLVVLVAIKLDLEDGRK